jgi:hypothetical protein
VCDDAASVGVDHADDDADAVRETLEAFREDATDVRVRAKL